MILFKSVSILAPIPAINIVKIAIIINGLLIPQKFRGWWNRIIKYTPAVTRVDEWTKADTGVGAAIAAGSQAENGIWALLVHAAVTTILTANPHK
jgi:hypothetical protein